VAPGRATPFGSTTLPLIRPEDCVSGCCPAVDACVRSAAGRPFSAPAAIGVCQAKVAKPQTRRLRVSQTNLAGPRSPLWTISFQDFLQDSLFVKFTVITLRTFRFLQASSADELHNHNISCAPPALDAKPARNGAVNIAAFCSYRARRRV
jgi:hypothetical protein